jgi:hypothetical protein
MSSQTVDDFKVQLPSSTIDFQQQIKFRISDLRNRSHANQAKLLMDKHPTKGHSKENILLNTRQRRFELMLWDAMWDAAMNNDNKHKTSLVNLVLIAESLFKRSHSLLYVEKLLFYPHIEDPEDLTSDEEDCEVLEDSKGCNTNEMIDFLISHATEFVEKAALNQSSESTLVDAEICLDWVAFFNEISLSYKSLPSAI